MLCLAVAVVIDIANSLTVLSSLSHYIISCCTGYINKVSMKGRDGCVIIFSLITLHRQWHGTLQWMVICSSSSQHEDKSLYHQLQKESFICLRHLDYLYIPEQPARMTSVAFFSSFSRRLWNIVWMILYPLK